MTSSRWTSVVLFASLLVAAGCPATGDQAAKPEVAKTDATKTDATKTPEAAPVVATPVVAKADADADEKGCIYVEGEQGGDPSCPHGGGEAGEPQGPATGTGHFGAPFSNADAQALPLHEVLAAAPSETPVLVKGEVEAVCQKKGCWMVVKDGAESARVLMKDHSFALPMDCRGKAVTIEGTLATRTFDEAQVKHLEKDAGGNPETVSGERTEHVLTASGVLIQS